jgi:nicotinate-nucleotide pyrophosphorylase (carboxylating)
MMQFYIDDIIKTALLEDVNYIDVAADNLLPDNQISTAKFLAKADGVLCGIDVALRVFELLGNFEMKKYKNDGDALNKGDIIAEISGPTKLLLKGERTSLNLIQHMSGIATMTHKYQQALIDAGTKTRVLDTRKTTPGMRMLEKEAVKIGGGMNHRIGLFDMILLKDNHIDFCGGVHNAISRAKQYCKDHGKDLKIECEVRNWKELEEALAEGCDRIMFDNFTPEDTKKAVELVAGRAETESSGGITFETMIPYAKAGVDFISFGALTHSVKGLDMSFKAAGSDKLIIK